MSIGFEEVDPIKELHGHVDQTLRVAMAGAMQLAYVRGERELRERSEKVAMDHEEEKTAVRRRTADRAMAEALWRRAMEPEWWDQATPDQVARTFEAAYSYADFLPDAADALTVIDQELDERYGLALDRESGTARSTDGSALDRQAVDGAMPGIEAAARANDERLARWQEAVGADLAVPMVTSPAWPALETRLTELDGMGVDSAKALSDALAARGMGGSKDVARVLKFRLSEPAQKAKDKGLGVEREGLDRARLVNDTIAANQPKGQTGRQLDHGAAEDEEATQRRRMSRDRDTGPER